MAGGWRALISAGEWGSAAPKRFTLTRRAAQDALRDALKAAQDGTLMADERQTWGSIWPAG